MHQAIAPPTPKHPPLTEAQRELADQHYLYAMKIASIMATRFGCRREDLSDSAAIGLCDAARKFDPGMGLQFQTLAAIRIRGEIVDQWRHRHQTRRKGGIPDTLSLDMPVSTIGERRRPRELTVSDGDQGGSTLGAWLADPDPETAESLEFHDHLDRLARQLGDGGRVLRAYFGRCRTMLEIGREMGVSESRVSQLMSHALNAIRRDPEAYGFGDGLLVRTGRTDLFDHLIRPTPAPTPAPRTDR